MLACSSSSTKQFNRQREHTRASPFQLPTSCSTISRAMAALQGMRLGCAAQKAALMPLLPSGRPRPLSAPRRGKSLWALAPRRAALRALPQAIAFKNAHSSQPDHPSHKHSRTLAPHAARRAAAVAPQAFLGWLWPFGRAAAAAPPPPPVLVEPASAFTAATVLVLPVYFAMIAFPNAKLVRSSRAGRLWRRSYPQPLYCSSTLQQPPARLPPSHRHDTCINRQPAPRRPARSSTPPRCPSSWRSPTRSSSSRPGSRARCRPSSTRCARAAPCRTRRRWRRSSSSRRSRPWRGCTCCCWTCCRPGGGGLAAGGAVERCAGWCAACA